MKLALRTVFFTLFFPLLNQSLAQTTPVAKSATEDAEQAAIARYHTTLGKEGHLFSGSEFISYTSFSGEHQFFKYTQPREASLVYENLKYQQVPLLYDIVSDDVVVGQSLANGETVYLKLDKNRVSSFNLDGHTFIHLRSTNGGLGTGFYEQLYSGNSQVLAKRKKTYKKEVVTITFPADNFYYILKDGVYHPVKSKGSVLKIFRSHKKELTQYLKANNIVFFENRELAIARMAEHYDILTQAK